MAESNDTPGTRFAKSKFLEKLLNPTYLIVF